MKTHWSRNRTMRQGQRESLKLALLTLKMHPMWRKSLILSQDNLQNQHLLPPEVEYCRRSRQGHQHLKPKLLVLQVLQEERLEQAVSKNWAQILFLIDINFRYITHLINLKYFLYIINLKMKIRKILNKF